jgi:hypothetical protein
MPQWFKRLQLRRTPRYASILGFSVAVLLVGCATSTVSRHPSVPAATTCQTVSPAATTTALPPATTAPSVEVVSACKNVPAGNASGIFVDCPAGEVVLSGGFAGSTADEHIVSSHRWPNGWGGGANSPTTGFAAQTAYVLCLRHAPPGTTVDEWNGRGTIAALGTGAATASCPSSEHIIGGGFDFNNDFVNIYSAAKNGDSWVVRAHNGVSDTDVVFLAVAECLTASGVRVTEASTFVAVPPHHTQTAQARCPAASWLAGGGFSAAGADVSVQRAYPLDPTTWAVTADNATETIQKFVAYAECLSFS